MFYKNVVCLIFCKSVKLGSIKNLQTLIRSLHHTSLLYQHRFPFLEAKLLWNYSSDQMSTRNIWGLSGKK